MGDLAFDKAAAIDAAGMVLESRGYKVLEKDWRCPAGAADVVAADGDELVLAVVRPSEADGEPSTPAPGSGISAAEGRRMAAVAAAWAQERGAAGGDFRIETIHIAASRPGGVN